MSYQVTLVDSGCFHPDLRGTYVLRYPGMEDSVSDAVLSMKEDGGDRVFFQFNEKDSNTFKFERTWSARKEKYAEVKKRCPELPNLQPGMGFSSQVYLGFLNHAVKPPAQ